MPPVFLICFKKSLLIMRASIPWQYSFPRLNFIPQDVNSCRRLLLFAEKKGEDLEELVIYLYLFVL